MNWFLRPVWHCYIKCIKYYSTTSNMSTPALSNQTFDHECMYSPKRRNVLASYQDWPGYEAKEVYTCHWDVQVTCAALWWQTQKMPYAYLLKASRIHAWQTESNVNKSIGVVWFHTGMLLVTARISPQDRRGEWGRRERGEREDER